MHLPPEARTDRQGRTRKGSKWVRVRAGEHRWTDESGRRKNPSERRTYLLKHAWTDKAGCRKDPSGQGQGLESTDGWMSQDAERIQVSKGHSQLVQCMPQTCFDLTWCRPIEIRMRKGSRQGALTFANTDGQVRTWKERV